MNFSLSLLDFLKKQGSVTIPSFGTFYLHTITAELDKEGKTILPPGAEVAFKTDLSGNENDFSSFLATQKNISLIEAELEIKKQVNYWNATLLKDRKVQVENLGTFFLEDSQMMFSGNRTENLSQDFYGLEEINLLEIESSPRKSGTSYRLSKSLYWISPILIGVLAVTYLGITQPEMIFGKKSFTTETPKKEIIPVKIDAVKTDSINAATLVLDSLKNDSLQKAIAPIKAQVKKWSSKNYSKSKWKKAKKRQPR